MSNNFTDKNLDKYGVWVKKDAPMTKNGEATLDSSPSSNKTSEHSATFQNIGFMHSNTDTPRPTTVEDSLRMEVPHPNPDKEAEKESLSNNFDESKDKNNEDEYMEALSFDNSTGFAPISSELETYTDDTTSNKNETNDEDGLMSISSDGMEEIDLDDFLSGSEPVNQEKKGPIPEETSKAESSNLDNLEHIPVDEFMENDKAKDDSSIDLDIQFSEPIAEETNNSTKESSASAFDDMLDELTGSNDEMHEVSLSDFMDDGSTANKKDEEEVQEIPEPKTTIEEFSLDSIKTSSATKTTSTPSSDKNEENIASHSSASDDFEEISLDDFLQDESSSNIASGLTSGKEEKSELTSLSIGSAIDSNEIQDVSVASDNEIENIELFGNEIKVKEAAQKDAEKELESTETSKSEAPELMEERSHDKLDETSQNSASDIEEKTKTAENELTKSSQLSDLTSILASSTAEDFKPELPDFAIEIPSESKVDTLTEDKPIDTSSITKNQAFDDLTALTNDLLGESSKDTEAEATKQNDKTSELLMKLLNEISSMKDEISSLKNELVSVKEIKAKKPENEASQTQDAEPINIKKDNATNDITTSTNEEISFSNDETTADFSDIDIPEIESFDNADKSAEADRLSITLSEDLDKKANAATIDEQEGFFSDDNTEETISLTGDELDNILNTSDFSEVDSDKEASNDDFEVPEILDINQTVQGDAYAEPKTEDISTDINEEQFAKDEKRSVTEDSDKEPSKPYEESKPVEKENIIELSDDFDVSEQAQQESVDEKGSPLNTEIEIETEKNPDLHNESFLGESEQSDEPLEEETLIDVAKEESPSNELENKSSIEDVGIEDIISNDEEKLDLSDAVSSDEAESFNTDDLDTIVEDIPRVDLDVESLDKKTASNLEQKLSTVSDELSRSNTVETLPIDMKEEIKSVLTYMDQLLESLPEEKIEEFAKSEYFETYKKLFDDLGIS